MDIEELYKPSDVQAEGHACPARVILYGGTAGCGKTLFLRRDPVVTQLCGEIDRFVMARRAGQTFKSVGWALHLRRNRTMLEQTILDMLDFSKKMDPGCEWNSQSKILTHTCGYRMQFGHMQYEEDYRQYDTNEYTHIAMDEAVQFLFIQYTMLRLRIRTADPILRAKRRMVLASNPDSPAEGVWVKENFVDPAPHGRTMLRETVRLFDGSQETYTRMYIPAFITDNPDKAYARAYEADLRTLPYHIQQARLYANWNVVAGAFFEYEFRPDVHIVAPFKIPSYMTRFRVLDWGYKTAAVCKWYAVTEDDDLICYREVTWNYKVADEDRKDCQLVAMEIRNIEKRAGEWDEVENCSKLTGPADTQICEKRGNVGPTIEERMAEEGVYWIKCSKDRFAATQELLRRLKDIPKPGKGRPGITWFNTCVHTARTIPMIKVDPADAEVPLKGGDDHWLDCDFYAVLYRAGSSDVKDRDEVEDVNEPDDIMLTFGSAAAKADIERRKRLFDSIKTAPGGKYGYGL